VASVEVQVLNVVPQVSAFRVEEVLVLPELVVSNEDSPVVPPPAHLLK